MVKAQAGILETRRRRRRSGEAARGASPRSLPTPDERALGRAPPAAAGSGSGREEAAGDRAGRGVRRLAPLPRGARRVAAARARLRGPALGRRRAARLRRPRRRLGHAAYRSLVVCTARPELLARRPGWGGGKASSTTLSLGPLSDEDTARLVAALARAAGACPPSCRRRCSREPAATRSTPRSSSAWSAERGATARAELPLPETVQGIIAARLDGLAAQEKALLQDAAVVGKVFWLGAVAAIAGRERAEVERAAARARAAQGLRPARAPLLGRGRDGVRVPARARARRRLRPDPARAAGARAAPAAPPSGSRGSRPTGSRTAPSCSRTTTSPRSSSRARRAARPPSWRSPRGRPSAPPASGRSR